ncbi:MAG: DNA sulfur modification protein DndD [Planctomycetota bacterium]|nr:DNA sulfur modification protein DndD [Planctomycetota bacterium]
MILDRLILTNFGAYAGEQEAVLTPDDGKPIILFGGMNGGGKTTLLDSIQLGLYGSRARLSNRGKMGYQAYLAECINRGADPATGASIAIEFHRTVEGVSRDFRVQRSWRLRNEKMVESVSVTQDDKEHHGLTNHWDETVDSWLPASISHLFFFDGEQIKDLAEGKHAAEIIGTALHSLLGLDLVDRLETDLKVFESRKRKETLDHQAELRVKQAEEEWEHLNQKFEQILEEEGQLNNQVHLARKRLIRAEEKFEQDGGELFLKHKELEAEEATLEQKKVELEGKLRDLSAGTLPLSLVKVLLSELEEQAKQEKKIHHAKVLSEELEARDDEVVKLLSSESIDESIIKKISKTLLKNREDTKRQANSETLLDSEEHFVTEANHLRNTILPTLETEASTLLQEIESTDESLAQIQSEIERVPDEDQILEVQSTLNLARKDYEERNALLQELRLRKEALSRQVEAAQKRLEKVQQEETASLDHQNVKERLLLHSSKVRNTLNEFRVRIIKKHSKKIERLMLDSFQALLRKSALISNLTIDPVDFSVTLYDRHGEPLPFDRLSAGERQLLATALLWGLARASGRPVPTIIDTPLGRLDSSHRKHLIERYFPNASHQVLLLSTDEEIVGGYHQSISPFVTRSFHLEHDEILGSTSVKSGYFPQHETAI